MAIIKLENFKERLDRYKRWYPEHCYDRDDITILTNIGAITIEQATKLRKKEVVVPAVKKKRPYKVRPLTDRQFAKLMKETADDMRAQGQDIEACAIDVAEGLLAFNERLRYYARKQLNDCGQQHGDIKLYVAENIVG
jgi:hypothetical protein